MRSQAQEPRETAEPHIWLFFPLPDQSDARHAKVPRECSDKRHLRRGEECACHGDHWPWSQPILRGSISLEQPKLVDRQHQQTAGPTSDEAQCHNCFDAAESGTPIASGLLSRRLCNASVCCFDSLQRASSWPPAPRLYPFSSPEPVQLVAGSKTPTT